MATAKKSGDLKLQATIALTDRISKEVSSIEKSVSGLTKGFSELEASAAGLGGIEVRVDTDGAEAALAGMGDAAETAGASVDSMAGQATEADKSVEGLGKTAEETGEKTENAFEGVENALAVLGYAKGLDIIIDKFKEASEEAMEFEKSLAKLSTIADESIGMSELKEEIETLSDDTNKNVNDLSEAAYQAISASVDTAESVRFVADATKLAEGGFTESATSVDVLTTAINAYKLEASDAARISDMLINTQNLGKTTVDRLAGSMGAVIPIAAAYKVQIDQLSTGYVELTRQGIDTAMSGTYLRGMLQELGDSSSKVAQVLKSETGYAFADLMAKGYSLGDVLQVLGDSVNGNSAAFVELWSNIRASTGALALYNAGAEDFNSVLASMTECVGATDAAYAKMTNTTAHAKEGMENATSRLADSIGSDLNPALKGLYETGDAAFTWMAKVNEKCPVVTAALAGLTTGAVTLGGVLTVLAVSQIEAVTTAFGTLNAVMIANPIVGIIAGVVGLGAGLIALASATYEAVDPMEKLTASSEKQQREIEELQKEYDGLKSEGKGLSEEALRLKYQIDDLTTSFEANKKTLGDVVAEGEALQSSYDEIIGKYSEVTSGIENETAASLSLIQKLEDIADSTENAADKSAELEAIYNRLGKGLTISGFDDFLDVAADLEGYTEAAKAAVKAQSKKNLKEGLIETELDYDEQIGKEEAYIKGLKLMQKDAKALADTDPYSEDWNALAEEIRTYDGLIEEHEVIIDDLNEKRKLERAALEALSAEQQEAIDSVTNFGDAVETAKDVASDALSNLETAYDNAYNAALESIQGQIGLFEKMETKSDLSVGQMLANLESQAKYLKNYSDNLAAAKEMGLDEGLLKQLSDGSSESAGYLDTIVKGIKNGTIALDDMNKAYQGVSEAQASWAAQVAMQDVDVSLGIDEALRQTYSAIEQMDNITNAQKAGARAQVNAYIGEIVGADVSQVSELGEKILAELKPAPTAAAEVGAETAAAISESGNEVIDNYNQIMAEVGEKGINLNNTVFGNIDTNNRQILEWTQENIDAYRDIIKSWGEADPDALLGSISTIFGSSAEYNGIEIAFSPMLQTDNGTVLLSADTVDEYIYSLFDHLGDNWTSEDLFKLDAEGLEIDGQHIQGLIADIGDTAIKTGEAMHYVGQDGAVALAFREIEEAASDAGMSVEAFFAASEAAAQTDVGPYDSMLAGVIGTATTVREQASEIKSSTADIVEAANTADQKVTETADNMTTTLGAVADETPELGANAIIGFINGMNSQQAQLEAAAAALAGIVSTAFQGTLDIGSPSKVMMEDGRFAAEGAILGVEEKLGDAEKMGKRLGESFSLSYRDSETLKNAGGYGRTEYRGDTIIRIDMSGMRNEVSGEYDVDRMVKDMENRLTEALYNTAAGSHR